MRTASHLVVALSFLVSTAAVAQTITQVAPARVARGSTVEVVIRGTGLDALQSASIEGDGLALSGFVVDSETLARFTVGVGDRAALGARDLSFATDGSGVVLPDAITLQAGAVDVLTAAPATGRRGSTYTVTLTGRNLDTVTSVSLGAGITISDYVAVSPVRATFDATVTAAAFSGVRALNLNAPQGAAVYESAFTVEGGTVTLGRITPGQVVRGSTATLTIVGENLDRATGIDLGPRITVNSFAPTSPTQAEARITIRDDAATGPRTAALLSEDGRADLTSALRVNAGDLSVTRLVPGALRQGQTLEVSIEGLNLEGVTTIDAGPGVIATDIVATFPTALTATLTADTDAALGARNVTVSGPNGSDVLAEALTIGALVVPDPRLTFTESLELGSLQIGARGTAFVVVENVGSIDETVTIGPVRGDDDLFRLLDPTTGEAVTSWTSPLAVGEELRLTVLFDPLLRGTYGAAWPVTVRDDETIGEIVAQGTGVTSQLIFNLVPPIDGDRVIAGNPIDLPRLQTRLIDGVLPRSVVITGFDVTLTLDGEPVEDPASVLTVELVRTVSGETTFWGLSEVDWRIETDVPGRYEGELLFTTDSPIAPLVPAPFFIDVVASGGGDAGADAGVDAGPDPDAGTDAGPDADPSDAGSDVADDTTAPDSTPGEDTTAPDSTPTPDTGADSGTTPDADEGDGGGDSGGCSTTSAPAAPLAWATALLMFVGWRRRARA